MTTNEYNDKSMNFRRIRRFLVEWLTGGEGSPTYPWDQNTALGDDSAPSAGPLGFDAGLTWGDGGSRTLAWTWEAYDPATGLPNGDDGDPAIMRAARYKFYGAVTAGPSIAFFHNFNQWPLVQAIQRGGGAGGVPWLVFDVLGAGGSILHDIGFQEVTIDFGGAFDGVVILAG